MPKCTVTVNKENELVYPDRSSFASANSLLTVDNLYNLLPENAVRSLKLTGYDEENNAEYKVELSVSITNIDGELIPQINLRVLDQED